MMADEFQSAGANVSPAVLTKLHFLDATGVSGVRNVAMRTCNGVRSCAMQPILRTT